MAQQTGFVADSIDRIQNAVESAQSELEKFQKDIEKRRKKFEKRAEKERGAFENEATRESSGAPDPFASIGGHGDPTEPESPGRVDDA